MLFGFLPTTPSVPVWWLCLAVAFMGTLMFALGVLHERRLNSRDDTQELARRPMPPDIDRLRRRPQRPTTGGAR
jgi:hypothetical protein